MDAAQQPAHDYQLKDDLARLCLPQTHHDASRKLAWANSICALFLLIGIFGARRGMIVIQSIPALEQNIPVTIEPVTLPPQETVQQKVTELENDAPQVAVVIPQTPNITFSVPTIGALVVPARLAAAPPLEPMRAKASVGSISSTGSGGDRPEPPYPVIARQTGQQGTVIVLMSGDAAGNIVSVDVKNSSGFPILDRSTTDFIKRRWRLPAGGGLFQTSITYQLKL